MTRAIADVPGVISEGVRLDKDDVIVSYDDRKTSPAAIGRAIADAGYHPHNAR